MSYEANMFGLEIERDYPTYSLIKCPFHNDTNASAILIKATGQFRCLSCGIVKFPDDWDDADLRPGMAQQSRLLATLSVSAPKTIEHVNRDWTCYPEASEYLKKRGVTSLCLVKEYNMYYNPFMEAIVFKNYITRSKIYNGFVYRFLNPNGGPRYSINGEHPVLWPEQNIYESINEPIFISEGPFKAMRLFLAAYLADEEIVSVTTFGANLLMAGTAILHQYRDRKVYLIADNDEAGQNFAKRFKQAIPWSRIFTPKVPFDDMTDDAAVSCFKTIWTKINDAPLFNLKGKT